MWAVSWSIMCDPNKNKMAGVNSRFVDVFDSEIFRIQEDAVPESVKKGTKFGLKVFKGMKRLLNFGKQCFEICFSR